MNNQFGRGAFATPPITLNLIIANFVVWLACAILPIGDAIREYGMLYWVGSEKFHLYQFFTYMFLHADFQHMFFNMFSLWMFGRTLEIDLGPKKFLTYFAYMKYEKGEEKNEFFNSFINRVILYDDKVIILYNSNDRETKRLNKKQLKEIESGKNLEEIKENSSERKKFKRVALGGESEI